ncbi:hypothetical protein [Bradyrhizobium sp. USDA 3364]
MPAIKAILTKVILVSLFLLTFLTPGIPQDQSEVGGSEDPRREWSSLARGRTEFEVSDPELVPSFLKLAADQSSCKYKEGLKIAPVHFLRIANRRLALVTCYGPLKSTQRAFDLSNPRKPFLVKFPLLAYPDGIGTSDDAPGFMNWDRQTSLFRAETTSDVSNVTRERYTYRFGGYDFVLLRVEVQRDGVGEWAPLWDAPRLDDLLAKPK